MARQVTTSKVGTKPGHVRRALGAYRKKRSFEATPEPSGNGDSSGSADGPTFVVHKHAASRLHYDFRLELDGTLKSWAVPKGIPLGKGERRLAVEVEDHPIDYGKFEGTIPKGQYGAGTVMLWDRGRYEATTLHPEKDLKSGKLHVILHGGKLQGEWALVRMRESKNWLIIRIGPSARAVSRAADDRSAVSGRSMREIAAVREAPISRPDGAPRKKPLAKPRNKRQSRPRASVGREVPQFIAPMLAKLVERPPERGEWHYEVKFDGYRVLARKHYSDVNLISRNGIALTQRFPTIAEALAVLPAEQVMLDGEVVALDTRGRMSFGALHDQRSSSLFYYAFDLLWSQGRDLRSKPLAVRRQELHHLLANSSEAVRYSEELKGEPRLLLEKAAELGFEGLIGKRAGSAYESGQRTGAWIKLKCVQQQEFVIGGFTAPRGSRQHFGALLVGYYADSALRFAGKVGTGFSESACSELHAFLAPLEVATSPFADPDKSLRSVHWVKPVLVCQLKFTEWTRDGRLRHPVYLGLRDDSTQIRT
jgi:bifunctional non-homologous end joining protein LigD